VWIKYLIVVLIFYLFAILQSSFFAHFNLFGAVPNLVFIFFILLVFFERKRNIAAFVFYSVAAGIFLDISSSSILGISVVFLLIVGSLLKIARSFFREGNDKYSFLYFLGLFLTSFLIYVFLTELYFYFSKPFNALINLNWKIFADITYNLFFSVVFFLIYKKIFGHNSNLSSFRYSVNKK